MAGVGPVEDKGRKLASEVRWRLPHLEVRVVRDGKEPAGTTKGADERDS